MVFICFQLIFYLQTKPLQGQTQDLVKAFISKIDEVGKELKAKNPELFSGDTKKLQVSSFIYPVIVDGFNRNCFFSLSN